MVYLPTFSIKKQLNAGQYTIHGWYWLGFGLHIPLPEVCSDVFFFQGIDDMNS